MLRNIPIDADYNNTLYFSSRSAQTTYFQGETKYTFTRLSYERTQADMVKVERPIGDLYDCNYMMFQNASFENKWFYAFVRDLVYINNETTGIVFEIDPMQTWLFDYTLLPCFVEREHTISDVIGEHRQPEPINITRYVYAGITQSGSLTSYCIVVAATVTRNGDPTTLVDDYGGIYGGAYSGVALNVFPYTTAGVGYAQAFLEQCVSMGKSGGIVSVFLCPSMVIPNLSNYNYAYPSNHKSNTPETSSVTLSKVSSLTRADGLALRNNKLYTHPYNFLYVSNMQGNTAEYKYEDFSSENCVFRLIGDFSPTPSVALQAESYENATYNFDQQMTVNGWPTVAWACDAFTAWLANPNNSAGAVAGAMTMSAGAAAKGLAMGSVAGLAAYALGTAATVARVDAAPPQAHGVSSSNLLCTLDLIDFIFIQKHMSPEELQIADEYLSAYGYAVNRYKVPNRNARPYWTYVKTRGCDIDGNIPADVAKQITGIYDKGIRWWTSASNVGNFALDNSPTP